MHVLLVKTSSLGDVLHALPAVTDAVRAHPDLRFDWVVEEAFAEIPAWHPAVAQVIPVALRRWRREPWRALAGGELRRFLRALRARRYDKVIDAQGLLKSAFLIARLARGVRCGLDRVSAREPLAALAYDEAYAVAKDQHAVARVRRLFAAALGYDMPPGAPDYGIERARFAGGKREDYVVFLHGTSWPSKEWPEEYWCALAARAEVAGLAVYLPWGNAAEHARAGRIAQASRNARVAERMDLNGVARLLAGARAVAAVDTGLGHLAAALAVPCVTVYGATDPARTGTLGAAQTHLRARFACAPCFSRRCTYTGAAEAAPACYTSLAPETVWHELEKLGNL